MPGDNNAVIHISPKQSEIAARWLAQYLPGVKEVNFDEINEKIKPVLGITMIHLMSIWQLV